MGNTETFLAAGSLENRWRKILPVGKCLNKDFWGLHLDFKILICYLKKALYNLGLVLHLFPSQSASLNQNFGQGPDYWILVLLS